MDKQTDNVNMCSTSHEDTERIEPHFIEMNAASMQKYRHLIAPVKGAGLMVCEIDNTLYNVACGLEDAVVALIKSYLVDFFGCEQRAAECVVGLNERHTLYAYGALVEVDGIDMEFYKKFVSSKIAYGAILKEDRPLKELLNGIDCRKICFTNGDVTQAFNILQALDLLECFEAVVAVDISSPYFIHKPQRESFEFVEELFGVEDSRNILFFDDSQKNTTQAILRGWTTHIVPADCYIGHLIRHAYEMLYLENKALLPEEEEVEIKDN